MTSLIIILAFLSPWLIWHSYLFYFILVDDKSFNLIIVSKKQLKHYWIYILTLLLISFYIFCLRFNNIGRMINVYDIWKTTFSILKELSWYQKLTLVLIFLLLLIFWIMFTRLIFHYLKQCILAFYLYYFQYNFFRHICYWIVDRYSDYVFYLMTRVRIFTKNPEIIGRSAIIWPWGVKMIERNLYFFMLPYLIIFDIIIQNGQITTIFLILPWFYLYSLFRGFMYIFNKLFNVENHDLSEDVYGGPRNF